MSQLKTLNPLSTASSSATSFSSPSIFALSKYGVLYLNATLHRSTINEAFTRLANLSTKLTEQVLGKINAGNQTSPLGLIRGQVWIYSQSEVAKVKSLLNYSSTTLLLNPDECQRRFLPHVAKSVFKSDLGGCALVREDFSLDARNFVLGVVDLMRTKVDFRFNTRVAGLSKTNEGRVDGVVLDDGSVITADHVVVASGPWAKEFVKRELGVDLPIMPVRGCSVDLQDVENGPSVGLADMASHNPPHFQMTPYGNRLRLIGFAQSAATPNADSTREIECPSDNAASLIARAKEIFPKLKYKSAHPPWCGLRPVTPDLLPIVGRVSSNVDNVWVNVGHGAAGWTLCASTGFVLSQALFKSDARLSEHVVKDADVEFLVNVLGPKRGGVP